jgi:regulator of RNase E activity RraA
VMPGDVIVGDEEGAVVIPAGMVDEIAAASVTMEIEEEFAIQRVGEGASTVGYFPLADENRAEFEAWLAEQG